MPEGSRCRGSSWSWGAGVWACSRRTPPEWPGCPAGGGGPAGSGQKLTCGLSADLSHDGAFAPQVLETEAQEAVNDEGCKQVVGIEPGPPTRPAGCTELLGSLAQRHRPPPHGARSPALGRSRGGNSATCGSDSPHDLAHNLSRLGPASTAPPHLGSLRPAPPDLAIRWGPR